MMILLTLGVAGLVQQYVPVRTPSTKPDMTAEVPASAMVRARAPPPVLELPGDTLEELPEHRAIVVGTSAIAVASAAHAAAMLPPLEVAFALLCALAFADLLTGVFHHLTDNYGNLDTPVVGAACAAFQGHHRAPWTITYRSTCNNVHKIAKIVAPLIVVAAVSAPPALALFLVVALYCQMLAQEFHKFAHLPPSEQPGAIRLLQDAGLIISTKAHGRHHTVPFDGLYCIFNGWLNPILDSSLFFRRVEAAIYRTTGVEANCWQEGDKGQRVKDVALSL